MGLSRAALSFPAGFGAPQLRPSENVPISLPSNIKTNFSPSEESVLKLLADGHSQEVVAGTLGITPSAVSQYISRDDFRAELARRKSESLEKYKKLDNTYDRIEQSLAEKLEASVFMMTRPGEITAALSKINAMKRRVGATDHGSSNPQSTIVNITLPVQIVHKFTTTQEGHIVGIDEKSLVTIPSNTLNRLAQNVPKLEHK